MKYGVRKPNVKKSIKARTTGKVKRQVKKAVNPLYGKKGMGIVNDPKKAAYNAVYSRTTVGVSDVMKSASSGNGHTSASYDAPAPVKKEYSTGHTMSAELSSWFSLLCLCFWDCSCCLLFLLAVLLPSCWVSAVLPSVASIGKL
mgnify:CR=1 FL=1